MSGPIDAGSSGTDAQMTAPGSAADAVSSGWSPDPDSPAATLPLAGLTAGSIPGPSPVIPGHISIAPRALTRVGSAVVAEALDVDTHDVRVDARDDAGNLALRVETTLRIPPLGGPVTVPAGGVLGTVRDLQQTVTSRVREITGRSVSRVDVTITGSRIERKEGPR